jgi:RecA-family ATPase
MGESRLELDPMAFSDDEAADEALREQGRSRRRRQANGHDDDWREIEPLAPSDPATLDGLPVPLRQWLVTDWVPLGRVTALYGAGGEGKTILAQMLATACAIDDARWLGLPVQRCKSLLLFCEDDLDEMHRRQNDINRHFGCTFADLAPMRWLPRLGSDNALMTFDGRPQQTPLFEDLLHTATEHEARLIITDTLADVFAGDENHRGQARMFAQAALGLLARETKGAVLALAHPSRAGMNSGSGESGSTAWVGTFRSQLYLSTPKREEGEPPDPDARMLTRRKSNAARRDETIELRWKDGVFAADRPPTGILGSIERRSCERVFLDLLDAVTAEGRHVSESSRAPNYAPKLFAQRPDRESFKAADFRVAMQGLFARKEIIVATYRGPNRHEHDCIGRNPNARALGALGSR